MSTPCQIIIVMEGGGNGRIRHLWLQLTSFLKQTFFNVCETWMMGPGQSVCFRLTTWKMTWNSACTRLFAEMVHTGTASRYVCIPVKRPDEVHPNMFKPPFFCRGAKSLLDTPGRTHANSVHPLDCPVNKSGLYSLQSFIISRMPFQGVIMRKIVVRQLLGTKNCVCYSSVHVSQLSWWSLSFINTNLHLQHYGIFINVSLHTSDLHPLCLENCAQPNQVFVEQSPLAAQIHHGLVYNMSAGQMWRNTSEGKRGGAKCDQEEPSDVPFI